jgi:DNA transformation protein
MARNAALLAHVLDLLEGWGRVNARPQFSGWCLTRDGVVFALLLRDSLYFKVDDGNRAVFAAAGMAPFRYSRAGEHAVLTSYWEAPPSALDDPDELAALADGALAAGRRKQAKRGARQPAASKVKSHHPRQPEVPSNRSSDKKARTGAKRGRSAR